MEEVGMICWHLGQRRNDVYTWALSEVWTILAYPDVLYDVILYSYLISPTQNLHGYTTTL